MFNNGTVSTNSSYEDICTKQFVNARVAYPTHSWAVFQVDNETNTMVEWDIDAEHGYFSMMTWPWEILKPFIMHHNILVTWVPCCPDGKSEIYKVPQFFIAKCNLCILIALVCYVQYIFK